MGHEIFVMEGGGKTGPFSESDIRDQLISGAITYDALIWFAGRKEPAPLRAFVDAPEPEASSPIPSMPPALTIGAYTNPEILRIAEAQKWILWIILATIVLTVVFPPAVLVTSVAALACALVIAVRLRRPMAYLLAVCTVVPVLGILALLFLNTRVNRALRERGIRVGFMGAAAKDLDELRRLTT